jgi:general stress protein CsbA
VSGFLFWSIHPKLSSSSDQEGLFLGIFTFTIIWLIYFIIKSIISKQKETDVFKRWNLKQKTSLLAGIIVFYLVLLFPPVEQSRYHLGFIVGKYMNGLNIDIRYTQWYILMFIVFILTYGFIIIFKDTKSKDKEAI